MRKEFWFLLLLWNVLGLAIAVHIQDVLLITVNAVAVVYDAIGLADVGIYDT